MSTEELLPPNYAKLDVAFRSIGYSFEVATADVVDNSIDAKASRVLVRLIITEDDLIDLAICDDGCGMDENDLKEAMRFGANVSLELKRLGKFGLGLKLASLSQAREFRVVSAKNGVLCGRAWRERGVATGFMCTIYNEAECKKLISRVVPDQSFAQSATVVWWSNLYRVGHYHLRAAEHAQKLMHRLENYLALAFHRFISGRPRKLSIALDILDEATGRAGIPITLDPLDPFDYGESGDPDFQQHWLLKEITKSSFL